MKTAWIGLAALVLVASATAQGSNELEQPFRLKAGAEWIDTGAYIAHAGPLFADYDGDGLEDLLVGNFKGHIQLYKNTGKRGAPVLEDHGLMKTGGEPIRIHNW
jgi:hypothetical protein